jgi:hypothetical protein
MDLYELRTSSKPNKKYMVIINNKKTIHFGSADMSDYTKHKDNERKMRYIARHQKNEDWNNLRKAGTWARYILWNKKTIKESIASMEKIFNIRIN